MGKSAAQQRKAGEKASKKASKQTVEELRAATTHPCTKLHLYQVGEYQLQDAQLLEPFEVTSRKWNQKIGGECRGTALPLTAADCRWLPLAAAGCRWPRTPRKWNTRTTWWRRTRGPQAHEVLAASAATR